MIIFSKLETNQSTAGDATMTFDGWYDFMDGQFDDATISMRTSTRGFDVNENAFDSAATSKLKSRYSIGLYSNAGVEEANEPPLLQELEIYPEQILEKALIMINPFASDEFAMGRFLVDSDLSGPLFFCFLFGAFLFLAGKVFIFSHMYGLMMVSIIGLYGLLMLLCNGHHTHFITIKGVASALGYGMQHLIWLSFVGIFVRLDSFTGFALATTAIILSTCGATRILSLMMNQPNYSALIAYPIVMVYTLFVFLIVF